MTSLRSRGRPRGRWLDEVVEVTELSLQHRKEAARDRNGWRELTHVDHQGSRSTWGKKVTRWYNYYIIYKQTNYCLHSYLGGWVVGNRAPGCLTVSDSLTYYKPIIRLNSFLDSRQNRCFGQVVLSKNGIIGWRNETTQIQNQNPYIICINWQLAILLNVELYCTVHNMTNYSSYLINRSKK